MNRLADIVRFYEILDCLAQKIGGPRLLMNCAGHQLWPKRGVYFFFEHVESRSDSGVGLRVVRIGTHALTDNSKSSLWSRLAQHRGSAKLRGGNHRGSIFRLLVGTSLQRSRAAVDVESWGHKQSLGQAAISFGRHVADVREGERHLEFEVSLYVGAMPFLWLDVPDAPGSESVRGIIERGAIALLSDYNKVPIDEASKGWLGLSSDRDRVCRSGLWNNRHVDELYDPDFLIVLNQCVAEMHPLFSPDAPQI